MFPTRDDYLHLLAGFPRYAKHAWRQYSTGISYFGDPNSGENGLRTQCNAAFTLAVLISAPGYDEGRSEVSRDELMARFSSLLAYITRTHRTGDLPCAAGGQWGLVWQSAWWTTRLAVGAQLLWDPLTQDQRDAVIRVVIAEANHQLGKWAPSGLAEDTKAEENAWDAEVLAVALALVPDDPKADRWLDKFRELSINTLSCPQDLHAMELVDGRPVCDQVYTVNLHSDFTLENHGAFHFCYVASPLSSIAWARYALKQAGISPPEAQFHHVPDLWRRVKPLFLDNRFAYISGKDWARYTYGLYFIVPVLVMLQHEFDDPDARYMECARVKRLAEEYRWNDDGSWFGKRVTRGQYVGQNAKYETDCYASIGLAYLLHSAYGAPKQPSSAERLRSNVSRQHVSPECGIAYVQSEKLFASFSFRTLTQPWPTLQFIPAGCDDLSEWAANNLLGKVRAFVPVTAASIRTLRQTKDGFFASGTVEYRSSRRALYVHEFTVEVDASLAAAMVKSRFISRSKHVIREADGLNFCFANDFFNGFRRRINFESGEVELVFEPLQREGTSRFGRTLSKSVEVMTGNRRDERHISTWANVDGKIGVIQLAHPKPFTIRRSKHRNVGSGSLHCEWLGIQDVTAPRRTYPGQVIMDTRYLLVAGDAPLTKAIAMQLDPSTKDLDEFRHAFDSILDPR